MRTNEYYSRNLYLLSIILTILVYFTLTICSVVVVKNASATSSSNFTPNYDKQYRQTILMTNQVNEPNEPGYVLSDIEYDISTLYLNQSQIEAERIRNTYKEKQDTQIVLDNSTVINESISTNVSEVGDTLSLPTIEDTSFKGYMCMHKVTSQSSKQWEFLHSGNYKLSTDVNGIMKYNNYYVVAMGSYYTNYKVGSTFRITFDSNISIDVITGDEKADNDTDVNNMYRPKGEGRGELVEFIIACGEPGAVCNNYAAMSSENRSLGNLSSLGFQGNVIKIEKIEDNTVVNSLYS